VFQEPLGGPGSLVAIQSFTQICRGEASILVGRHLIE
jgi:hypothetical protein